MDSFARQLTARDKTFMLSTYFNITVVAEWCTFVVAVILLDKKTKVWQLFILLLLLTLCVETFGWYLSSVLKKHGNALPFNFLMLIGNSFFIWFFTKAKSLEKLRRILLYFLYFFLVIGLINLFWFQGFWIYNSHSETVGDIMTASICCYFFYTLLTADEHINLLRFDYFWLATGLLFYSLGSALLYQFSGTLKDYYDQYHLNIGTYINYTLNLILYICFVIAFFFRWKTTR